MDGNHPSRSYAEHEKVRPVGDRSAAEGRKDRTEVRRRGKISVEGIDKQESVHDNSTTVGATSSPMIVLGRRSVALSGALDTPQTHVDHASGRMPLNTTLADITTRLRQNRFPNEQAISQGIVLRVLRELGWDTYDANVVWPEYQTAGGGRADFALCHPPSKPRIFIEVKHLGKGRGRPSSRPLLYAFKSGVPFVVLTDGRTWSFYLPAEPGDYDERRVYKLDLYERSPDEAAEKFRQYLANESVASGESLRAARTEYHNLNRRSQAKAAIPEAWRETRPESETAASSRSWPTLWNPRWDFHRMPAM